MKRSASSLLLLFFFFVAAVTGQNAAPPIPPPAAATLDPQYGSTRGAGDASWNKDQLERMQKQQHEERQKQLKADTDKLLQLATDLKTSVDKTNEHILSLDVIKKAEEIERLAKHIKTNMRDEVR
jgi:hypothetical protein